MANIGNKDFPVRIVDRHHAHYGETGVIQAVDGKVTVSMFGDVKCYKIWLDACPEGMESTIADFSQLARHGTPKKRKGAAR